MLNLLLHDAPTRNQFTTTNHTQRESLTSVGLSTERPSASTWDTYYYEKNLQGDILAVYNTSGTKLVSYTYGFVTSKFPMTIGGDVNIIPGENTEYWGVTGNLGIGGSLGPEVHATWGQTKTVDSYNCFNEFDRIYRLIMGG